MKFELDWEVLDVVLGGKSAIDSQNPLSIRGGEDALRFMECYGYDLEEPIQKAELFGNFQEALNFIKKYFLQPANPEGLKLEVPRKLAEMTDVAQLLTLASASHALTMLWACAIIKVMHTISHMDKDLRTHYFGDIQTQILDRFYKHIHSEEGQVYLGRDNRDPERVDLMLVESKPKKARDSTILKLLHKSENVAEDIFDRVGIRFVTHNRYDCIRVLKYLKERYVIMPANLKPSRSRNNLIDVAKFTAFAAGGERTEEDFRGFCNSDECLPNNGYDDDNPHSSVHYRAIQFTARQLIRIKNPLYDDLKNVKGSAKGLVLPEAVGQHIERINLGNIQREIRFFYPFEVQIYDQSSHEENIAGQSSHSNYKKSQVQAAMKRVMGDLLRVANAQS